MRYDFIMNDDQRRLVEKSLQLVRWTVKRYISSNENMTGLGFDDLYQEGCVALCRAVPPLLTCLRRASFPRLR